MKIQETGNLRNRFTKLKTKEVFVETNLPFSDKDIDKACQIDSRKMPGAFGGCWSVIERTMDNDGVDSLRYFLDAFTEITPE